MRGRIEVKDVQSDEWNIHATFYKEYCAKLKDTEEAKQEHQERVGGLADKIVADGTPNTTEGNWAN